MVFGNGKIRVWKREPNEFGRRFEIRDIKGLFRKHITIEAGTKALFLQGGRFAGELPPGTYKDIGGVIKAWRIDIAEKATVILVDVGDVSLDMHIEDLLTKESVHVGVSGNVTIQAEAQELNKLFSNLMKGRELLEIHDVEVLLEGEMKNILQAKVKDCSVKELYGNLELKKELEQDFEHQMKTTLERTGLKLVQVPAVEFVFPEDIEEIVKRRGGLHVKEEDIIIQERELELQERKLKLKEKEEELKAKKREIEKKGEIDELKVKKEVEEEKRKLEVIEPEGEIKIPAHAPKIVVLSGVNAGKEYLVEEDGIGIGRNGSNKVVIDNNDLSASRFHAKVFFKNGEYFFQDHSANGTRFGSRTVRKETTKLQSGAVFEVGKTSKTRLQFIHGNISDAAPGETVMPGVPPQPPMPELPIPIEVNISEQEVQINRESKIYVSIENKSNQTISDVTLSSEFSNKLVVKNDKILIGRLLPGDITEEYWIVDPIAKGIFSIKPGLSYTDENGNLQREDGFKPGRIVVLEIEPKPEPPVPISATVKIINGANKGEEYPLDKIAITEDIRIGRCHACEIRMDENDRTASRHHARLLFENGAYFIEDTWSRNVTKVDGREINEKTRLRDKNRIEIGRAVLSFSERERTITVRDGRGMDTIRLDEIRRRRDIRIGRCPVCEIRMDEKDRTASRHHARIIFEDSEYFIEDICSADGTFVNGVVIEEKKRLEDGDEIKIGHILMQFRRVVMGG